MRSLHHRFVALPALALAFVHAQVVDDFSAGGWTQFPSTPGTMSVAPGALQLRDSPEPPAWITAGKTFTVDFEQTPWFLVRVASVSDRGTIKLIRREPYDKREALDIDRPGLYAVDMRTRFGWRGAAPVETCLYAIGDGETITYEFVRFAAALTPEEETLIRDRDSGGNTKLDVGAFEAVPLFSSCSYYFASPARPALAVRYRRQGVGWQAAFEPMYAPEDGMYRGSIVDLAEDTPYELQITDGEGAVLAQQAFRTWTGDVPVARTVVLDEKTFDGRLRIGEAGTPDGWIRYTAAPGFVLRNDRAGPLIELDQARYVLLEGLTLRGGLKEAVSVRKCECVRIVNCDIAGWGRVGTQRFDLDGKYYTAEGAAINWDSAILVARSVGTVIERCWIHDPVNTANPWYYSHPAGPQAVGIDKPRSTVLRYNDFIGSDPHRWNDAVEGAGNFHLDGGFHRDADIYGNLMCFANDDALEIDGGQTNVRVFLNHMEGCLCGVSIQGCMSGPSYVYRNLLAHMADERGVGGQTIKTSSHANGPSAVSFLFHNTCAGRSSDLRLVENLRIVAKNNIFGGRNAILGRAGSPRSECDGNLLSTGAADDEPHGILGQPAFRDPDGGLYDLLPDSPARGRGLALDNFAVRNDDGTVDLGAIPFGSDLVLPMRPIPVFLDRCRLAFSVRDGEPAAAATVTASVRDEDFSSRFRIARNDAFDWFEVAPAEGILESGRTQTFVVTPVPARMGNRHTLRGAFLIRLESGYSRPVMVYAETGARTPLQPSRRGVWVTYLEAETPSGGRACDVVADATASGGSCIRLDGPTDAAPAEYRFRVPAAGTYFVVMRVRSEEPVGNHDSMLFGVDDGPLEPFQARSAATWVWSLAAHNRRQSLTCLQPFGLSAGEHVVKLAPREPIHIDRIAVTDNPSMFE
ncbi:MAG: hypothetical protein JXR77_16325 [Lentisphaeria bacterium]|nr:hypothetical protein [Lentisphaeria bacterium]